jgi:hypothetical protein
MFGSRKSFLHSCSDSILTFVNRWLAQLHLNMDANFRQRNQARARGALNPPVINDKGYWVGVEQFAKHIVSRTDPEEVRICTFVHHTSFDHVTIGVNMCIFQNLEPS